MNNLLHRIKNAQFNTSLGRTLLGYYFREGRYYKVPMGPLKGFRLYYDKSVNFHAILGLWDLEGLEIIRKSIVATKLTEKKVAIADIGANIGYLSLWFSKMLAPGAKIYAFEPAPTTLAMLEKNLMANQAKQVIPTKLACSDREGEIEFFVAGHHHCSSLVESWANAPGAPAEKIVAKTVTLDSFFEKENQLPVGFIKMDIEGGGVFALPGCYKTIERYRPLIWVESHTPDEDKAISNVLMNHGYEAFRQQTRTWVTNRNTIHPDPNGVWGCLLLCPKEIQPVLKEVLS